MPEEAVNRDIVAQADVTVGGSLHLVPSSGMNRDRVDSNMAESSAEVHT